METYRTFFKHRRNIYRNSLLDYVHQHILKIWNNTMDDLGKQRNVRNQQQKGNPSPYMFRN